MSDSLQPATPWTAAAQASLSITNSRRLPKLMSIELVMPSSHLILCHPLLLLPSIFPSIRVFSNESALCIRWPKYWSFSFNISPSNHAKILNEMLLKQKPCFILTKLQFCGKPMQIIPGFPLHMRNRFDVSVPESHFGFVIYFLKSKTCAPT